MVQPPQAPLVGRRVKGLLGRFHITGVFWYQFHHWGITTMPEWTLIPLHLGFTGFFYALLGGMKRALNRNLEVVLGPAGWWERQKRAWKVLWNQAWCNSERYESVGTDHPFHVDYEGVEHWSKVADRSEGFVLVTAHVGSWDIASIVPSLLGERHIHVVREQEMDRAAQEFTETLYHGDGARFFTVHFSRDNPTLGAKLLAAMRRGDIVGLQGDRPSTTGRTVETRLFGRPFHLPVGPAALARIAEAPVVPVFCFREGRRRYRLVIREPLPPPKTADRERDHRELMQAIIREVEWAIREKPLQWFCFRDLWGEGGVFSEVGGGEGAKSEQGDGG